MVSQQSKEGILSLTTVIVVSLKLPNGAMLTPNGT